MLPTLEPLILKKISQVLRTSSTCSNSEALISNYWGPYWIMPRRAKESMLLIRPDKTKFVTKNLSLGKRNIFQLSDDIFEIRHLINAH